MKSINKDELNGCVAYLFAGLEDRNADVRKVSNEAIYPFMLHLGYEAMVRHTSKVKVRNLKAAFPTYYTLLLRSVCCIGSFYVVYNYL